jgi:hypothetical protein
MSNLIVQKKTALTGGGASALDGIDGAALQEGEFAFVMVSDVLYVYRLNATSGAAESSPNIIAPDANAGNKRWILQGDSLKTDGTAGRVLRHMYIYILNGTDAAHIKCQTVSRWNGDSNDAQDNIGKDAVDTGIWNLDATGQVLQMLSTGVTGNIIAVIATTVAYNASGTALTVIGYQTSLRLQFSFYNAATGAAVDLTTLVDTGTIYLSVAYITSA